MNSQSWLETKNERVTKETLVAKAPPYAGHPIAWYAMRAILAKVQKLGIPKSYMIDMAHDFAILHKFPNDTFVYCIRESGTDVFLPPHHGCMEPMTSLMAHVKVLGPECNWFTFDINDVRQGDDYNEPQLRPCTAEEAVTFMRNEVLK